ncbi:hypothetical protein TrLO_g4599 [Triparma laevis f. longispina]|uniref:Uncharacterized protein n=1 Tax=Triparma laevis f. longispina TaxID=1714387 RepID=A0A9W7FUZ3_9STRA|nr:hypothetical protein TrLO_g4599 [Triparma laevis f. longispina]
MKIAAASDAYDTLLFNTSKFTLHFSGSNSAAVFTLDSDSAKNALTIKLQPLTGTRRPSSLTQLTSSRTTWLSNQW